jgi:hypothetical protein
LIFILLVGTVVYSLSDSMTFVDAGYFTVVTATTVGFGDYVPSSNTAKVFTLFYVPLSVVMVAGALQRMAMIPLQKRNIALERYILESFGEHVSEKDFDEIRRTTHLKPSQPITPNDFGKAKPRLCCAVLCCAVRHEAVLRCVVQCTTVQCSAVRCGAVRCCAGFQLVPYALCRTWPPTALTRCPLP